MLSNRTDPRQPDSTDVDVGRLVRVHRMAQGLSQTELANQIGVTFQQVQKYESGTNRISMGRLTRIARVLEVNVTYLLAGSRQGTRAAALGAKEQARLAQAVGMLGRIGALRLLKGFLTIPTNPPALRESILHVVEGTAAATRNKTMARSTSRPRSAKRKLKARKR
jgi:transcriptional regulator with XRE-family HTH domain